MPVILLSGSGITEHTLNISVLKDSIPPIPINLKTPSPKERNLAVFYSFYHDGQNEWNYSVRIKITIDKIHPQRN